MRYNTVIWDWNGTLLDDVELALGIVNQILVDQGLQVLSRERYTQIFDFPVKTYYQRAGIDFSKTSFEVLSERFCSEFESRLDSVDLFAAAPQMLSAVKSAGKRQYVLSGTEHQMLSRMLKTFDLWHLFDGIKGLQDGLAHGKITAGEEMMNEFNVDPASTVLIGDTRHDFEVAETLGIDCLLVATGHHSIERLSTVNCAVYSCLTELEDYLVS